MIGSVTGAGTTTPGVVGTNPTTPAEVEETGLFDTTAIEGKEAVEENQEVEELKEAVEEAGGDASLDDIDALNAELDRLIKESDEAARQMDLKRQELETAKERLAEEQQTLQQLENDYKAKEKEYEGIQKAIDKATEDLEDSVKQNQKLEIYKAMAEYDETKDGDWDTYLKDRLGAVVGSSKIENLISSLSGQASSVARELGTIETKMHAQKIVIEGAQSTVNALDIEVQNLQGIIDTNEKTINSIQDKIVKAIMGSIGEAEMALVEANNIDLTEKLPDGSPKYIFAKGKEDGLYHIYEMKEDGTSGVSLARTYCSGGGFDVIRSGNGYLNGLQKLEDGACDSQGEKIYFLDDCGSAGSFSGCYTTCSPLTFDLNGDGIQTTDEIIDYDIDGDGIIDKIYNTSDAVLVFDKDGDGISGEDGSECFGDNTDLDGDGIADGYSDGFAALKALAAQEGLIGEGDSVLDADDLEYLEINFGLRIKSSGYNSEAVSLADLGITEINLGETTDTNLLDNFDEKGNQLMTQEGATFVQNGETKEYADLWHRKIEDEV